MQKQFLDNVGLTELLDQLGQYLKEVKADKTELPLIVHMDDTLQTCGTSIADIYTAYSVGRVVQMKIAGLSVPLSLVSSSSSSTAFAVTDKGTSLIVSGTNESGSDVWTIDSFVAQEKLTFDSTPTAGSNNPVTSGGVKTALDRKQDALVSGTNIKTINNTSLLGSGNITLTASDIDEANGDTIQDSLDSLVNGKQDTLVSGRNIKTINNKSVLASGNMDLSPYTEYANENELLADTTQRNGTIGFEYSTHKFFIYHATFQEWLLLAQGRAASNTFFEYAFDLVFTQ